MGHYFLSGDGVNQGCSVQWWFKLVWFVSCLWQVKQLDKGCSSLEFSMVSVRRNTWRDKFHGFITSVLTGMVSIYGTSIISVYTNIDTSWLIWQLPLFLRKVSSTHIRLGGPGSDKLILKNPGSDGDCKKLPSGRHASVVATVLCYLQIIHSVVYCCLLVAKINFCTE